jgi:hypothetical protein
MYRCLNDPFAYCQGIPLKDLKTIRKPYKTEMGYIAGNKCETEWGSCPFHKTQAVLYPIQAV